MLIKTQTINYTNNQFLIFLGEKCCLHVHGVYPYIFIPLEETYGTKNQEIIYNLASSLDKALCLAIGSTNSKSKYIHSVIIVSGK